MKKQGVLQCMVCVEIDGAVQAFFTAMEEDCSQQTHQPQQPHSQPHIPVKPKSNRHGSREEGGQQQWGRQC
jgi:hypothetical protein